MTAQVVTALLHVGQGRDAIVHVVAGVQLSKLQHGSIVAGGKLNGANCEAASELPIQRMLEGNESRALRPEGAHVARGDMPTHARNKNTLPL